VSSPEAPDALGTVVDRLRAEGWEIHVEPQLPKVFGNTRPDIVATRAGEMMVVELAAADITSREATRVAEAAAEAGFAYRAYGVAPPRSRVPTYLASTIERPPSDTLADALGRLRSGDRREDADVSLYRAFDLVASAGMGLEEHIGIRSARGLREEVEDFDISPLVARGYLGEQDGAAFDYTRRLLTRAGPATDPGGLAYSRFREDVDESVRRLTQIVEKLVTWLERFEGDPSLEVLTAPAAAAMVPPDASGVERTPLSDVVDAAEEVLVSDAERTWRNVEVLRALLARGIPTDRQDISAALTQLFNHGRAHRVKRGHYTATSSR